LSTKIHIYAHVGFSQHHAAPDSTLQVGLAPCSTSFLTANGKRHFYYVISSLVAN
jgi:hypothetical protein